MMRALWVTALLVAVTLAGCADGSQTPVEEEQFADIETKATSTTGVIRGVVFDAAIVPIADATITIKSLGIETTSSAEGSFAFENLEPGPYFIEVSKVGFSTVQSSTTVEAGIDRPPIVKVQLLPEPSALPFVEHTTWEGYLRCAGALVVVAFPCSVVRGTEDLVSDYNGYVEEFIEGYLPDFYQAELMWETTQALGESLTFDIRHCCDNDSFGQNGSAIGPSPLIANVYKHEMEAADVLEDGMEVSVFGAGLEETQGVGFGVGLQVEQPITVYRTKTVNFLPPEGWTFISDGALELPQ